MTHHAVIAQVPADEGSDQKLFDWRHPSRIRMPPAGPRQEARGGGSARIAHETYAQLQVELWRQTNEAIHKIDHEDVAARTCPGHPR